MSRKWDVVVWGATGYTGKLVVQYLAKNVRNNISWAIAGRSKEKLIELRNEVQSKFSGFTCGILVGDINNVPSLDAITISTRLLISAAGPYVQVGYPVVDSCVRNGCDYVDVTGETMFVRKVIDDHHETAKKKGILLVPLAGFDSVPSDIGTLFTVNRMRAKFGPTSKIRRVSNYAQTSGKMSGGTLASSIGMDKHLDKKNDLFLLGGRPHPDTLPSEHADQVGYVYDSKINQWVAPFPMAFINTRTVRRTHALLEAEGRGYGERFTYSEKAIAKDENQAKAMSKPSPPPEVMEKLVAMGKLPKQGEGPNEEQRAKDFSRMTFVGELEDGQTLVTHLAGPNGYDFTALCVVEVALCALQKANEGTKPSGVLTPAVALGESLIQRLQTAGVQFGETGSKL